MPAAKTYHSAKQIAHRKKLDTIYKEKIAKNSLFNSTISKKVWADRGVNAPQIKRGSDTKEIAETIARLNMRKALIAKQKEVNSDEFARDNY